MNRPVPFAPIAFALALAACDRDPTAPDARDPLPLAEPIALPSLAVSVVPGSVAAVQPLGLAPGFASARTWDANDDGVLVGQLCPSTSSLAGCVPARWTNLLATPLPLPDGAVEGAATAVNSAGVTVGYVSYIVTIDGVTHQATRAARWHPDAAAPDLLPMLFPSRPHPTEMAADINDQGHIVGRAGSSFLPRAALWSPTGSGLTLTPLRQGTSEATSADAINDAGVIVGYRWPSGGQPTPVRWSSSAAASEDLPLPDGYLKGEAHDVADDGTVVGEIMTATTSDPAVWRPAGAQVEVTVLPELGPQYGCGANAIGGRGWVVGNCGSIPVMWGRDRIYQLLANSAFQYDGRPDGISNSGLVAIRPSRPDAAFVLQLTSDPFLIADPGDSYTGAEGAAVAFDGTASSGWPAGAALSYEWNFGDGTTATGATPTHTYADNGTYAVTLRVSTGSELPSPLMRTTATINNVAPAVDAGADAAIEPGQIFTLRGSFSDAGTRDAPWSYVVSWGDGTSTPATSRTSQGAISASRTYAIPGTYTVRLTVRDKNGSAGFDELVLTVRAVKPTARPGGPYAGLEGAALAFNGGGSTDPNGDALSYSWSFGDGTTGTGATPTHAYEDAGVYTVSLTVNDGNGHTHTATTTATVANVPPRITGITVPAAPVPLGTEVSAGADFTGVPGDPFSAVVSWGDGATSSLPGVASGFTATHAYATPGVYTVRVRVTDGDGEVDDQAAATYVVVYDPSTSSFVAGSGTIDSPAGAMPGSLTAAGRAAFGFESRYLPGAQAPSGFTRFEFRAGALEFEATRFDWLVVAGTKAQFKGEGTIAGRTGTFQFMVSAVDGGAPSDDRFRLKITDAAGNVVYDNQQGAADGAQPVTTITSGNINVRS